MGSDDRMCGISLKPEVINKVNMYRQKMIDHRRQFDAARKLYNDCRQSQAASAVAGSVRPAVQGNADNGTGGSAGPAPLPALSKASGEVSGPSVGGMSSGAPQPTHTASAKQKKRDAPPQSEKHEADSARESASGKKRAKTDTSKMEYPPLPAGLADRALFLAAKPLHQLVHRIGRAVLNIGDSGGAGSSGDVDKSSSLAQSKLVADANAVESISDGVREWMLRILKETSDVLSYRLNADWAKESETRSCVQEQLDVVEQWSTKVAEYEKNERVERLKRLAKSKGGDEAVKKTLESLKKKDEAEKKDESMSMAIAAFTKRKLRKRPALKFALPPTARPPKNWNKKGCIVIYVKKEPGTEHLLSLATKSAPSAGSVASRTRSRMSMRDLQCHFEHNKHFSKSQILYSSYNK